LVFQQAAPPCGFQMPFALQLFMLTAQTRAAQALELFAFWQLRSQFWFICEQEI
jgi:hypothetical protein